MAGRPPLPVGTHGNIKSRELRKGTWESRCNVRDTDGSVREVRRRARSKQASVFELQKALDERPGFAGADIDAETPLNVVADHWFTALDRQVEGEQLSHATVHAYRSAWRNHCLKAIGALRCREATVPRINAFLVGLSVKSDLRASIRKATSGVLGYAVRNGALATNPVREAERHIGASPKEVRAMTFKEIETWLNFLETDVHAIHHELRDLTLMMLATGCRLSEMLAVLVEDVDFTEKTVTLDYRVIRPSGAGVQRARRRGRKGAGVLLRLPDWAVVVAGRRVTLLGAGPLFPSSSGGWRDPSAVTHAIAAARKGAGLEWVTSHSYRKTVATFLDRADFSPADIGAQLTHSGEATAKRFYIARRPIGDRAAKVLEAFDPDRPPSEPS